MLLLRQGDQPKKLVLMDHLAPLPKDPSVMAANRAKDERWRKAKEDERRKKQQKLRAWERWEETDSDDATRKEMMR